MKDSIMDQMVEMLTKYSKNLEETVKERTKQLEFEKRKTDELIHQILPVSVANQLLQVELIELFVTRKTSPIEVCMIWN